MPTASGGISANMRKEAKLKGPSGTIFCDVIGCGEEATHLNKPNPFDRTEKCDFCDRCLAAGVESVIKGHSEMSEDAYYHYYGRNWVGPSGYKVHRKLIES